MNKQEAIEWLKSIRRTSIFEQVEAIDMAIEALQFQDIMINNPKTVKPTPEVCKNCMDNDWIPCSERLPEEEKKTYWVCTDTECQCECRWTNNRFGIGEGEWGWSIFDTPQYTKPIAWQPLPEPYKRGKE